MKLQEKGGGERALAERLRRGERLEVGELLRLMDYLLENGARFSDAVGGSPPKR